MTVKEFISENGTKVWNLSPHLQEHSTEKVEEHKSDGPTKRTFQTWSSCSERILSDFSSLTK